MTNNVISISLRTAAFIAGITILAIALIAPYCELFVYPKLIDPSNAAETVKNIINNKPLFISAIFGYMLTFSGDILISWALYILLKPVNKSLSLLTALFRFIFSVTALVELLNLVDVFRLLTDQDYVNMFGQTQLHAQVMLYLTTFRSGYHFGILYFSIHLILLGCLVFRSGYIPKLIGIVLVISGLGYFADAIKPFLFPNFNSVFITITFFGELIFMFWLLIKGSGIKESIVIINNDKASETQTLI